MSEDKATLKLQVEKELREKIEATAEKEGLSVSAWVRRTLLCHFDAQDNPKKAEAPTVAPVISMSPQAQTQLAAEAIHAAQAPLNLHACAYLNPEPPQGFMRNECEGTCDSPRQRGHRCTWPSNVASNCSAYRPKKFEFKVGGQKF